MGEVIQQHQKIDRLVKDRLRAIREISSVADPLRKNTHHLQYFERLAHRCSVSAELLRHLPLGGKLGAGRYRAIRNEPLDARDQSGGYTRVLLIPAGNAGAWHRYPDARQVYRSFSGAD